MAPRTATISRSADLAPAAWSGPTREPLLIRATARAGQGRRAMSRVVHDVRCRLPRRAVAAFQAHKKRQAAERLAAGAAW